VISQLGFRGILNTFLDMRYMLLVLVLLSGCAQVGQYGAQDAATAAGIAAAVGDTAGAQCWPVWETITSAIAAAGGKPGVFTAVEEQRAFKIAIASPSCQPVATDLLAELLKLGIPGAGALVP